MKKEIPSKNIKTVRIDEILKNGKNAETIRAKRGRPAGSKKQVVIENAPVSVSTTTSIKSPAEGAQVSKAFIKAPFEVFAAVTKIADLQLTLLEIEAISPSFKIVYDKRIAPNLGQHADLFAFLMVFGGIAANKISIFNKAKAKARSPHPNFETENKTPDAPVESKPLAPRTASANLFPMQSV